MNNLPKTISLLAFFGVAISVAIIGAIAGGVECFFKQSR